MRTREALAVLLVLPVLSACSAGRQDRGEEVTQALKERVPDMVQVIELDTTGATHEAVGRDEGVLSRSLVYDSRVSCSGTDPASCGGVLEEWPSTTAAQKRADDLRAQGERAVVAGRMVLHLSGQLDDRAVAQYRAAMGAAGE